MFYGQKTENFIMIMKQKSDNMAINGNTKIDRREDGYWWHLKINSLYWSWYL